ncbi:MAG: LysR family transcriptional regulator [Clostridia bacterium]|nr:LysR family transcriptional regulator [Clostridia bacterium]
MNLKQFRYALVLDSVRSVSRAAEILGISQPSLSQYLKKTEAEVGAVLFDRSGNEIKPTDAGREFIEAGKKILDAERQMKLSLQDISDDKSGTLRIGTSSHRAITLMPESLRRFRKVYPGIRVFVDEQPIANLLDGLLHGDFDLCVLPAPADDHLFVSDEILTEEIILAAPKDLSPKTESIPGRRHPAVDFSILDGADVITLFDFYLMQRLLDETCRNEKISFSTHVTCCGIETQLAMVKHGLGVALVPSGADMTEDDSLSFYSFVQELPRRKIIAVRRKGQYCSRPMTEIIRIMKSIDKT